MDIGSAKPSIGRLEVPTTQIDLVEVNEVFLGGRLSSLHQKNCRGNEGEEKTNCGSRVVVYLQSFLSQWWMILRFCKR